MLEIELNDELITVEVLHYNPGADMIQTGMGMGDCIEPEPEEVEFIVRTPDGGEGLSDADWLALEDEVLAVMRQEQEDDFDA